MVRVVAAGPTWQILPADTAVNVCHLPSPFTFFTHSVNNVKRVSRPPSGSG